MTTGRMVKDGVATGGMVIDRMGYVSMMIHGMATGGMMIVEWLLAE